MTSQKESYKKSVIRSTRRCVFCSVAKLVRQIGAPPHIKAALELVVRTRPAVSPRLGRLLDQSINQSKVLTKPHTGKG